MFWPQLVARIRAFEPTVLVRIYLLMFAGMSLFFELLPFSPHQGPEHWVMIGIFAVLFVFAQWERYLNAVFHAALAVALLFLLSLITTTTGINSVDVIWFMVMGLPVLFLMGIRAVLIWLVVVEVVLAVTYYLSLSHVWPHQLTPSAPLTGYVLLSYLVALLSIMLMLSLYDLQQRSRVKTLDEGNRVLEEDYKSLVKSQRHKEQFVAAIGHELRTPMSAILGLNLLLRDAVSNQPEWQAAVDHIRRSTQQLLGVVNNVLDHSQLQAHRLFLMPSLVNVTDLLEEVREEFHDRTLPNHMTLDCAVHLNVPKFLQLDRARFKQILINLLDNAIKHSPQGADIRLILSMSDNRLHAEVHDRGPGLPPELSESLAQGLPLLPSMAQDHLTGAGLGLTICQALVKLHQGRMWVEPREGRGSCIVFEWPLMNSPQPTTLQAQSDWARLKQRPLQFLVADDEPVNLVVVPMQILKHMPNAKVQTANLSRLAMDKLSLDRFDVVILDMFMPDLSGLELTQWIRQPGQLNERALILALTASSNPDDWRDCMEAGMDGVLVKPFDVNGLLNAIHNHDSSLTRVGG